MRAAQFDSFGFIVFANRRVILASFLLSKLWGEDGPHRHTKKKNEQKKRKKKNEREWPSNPKYEVQKPT